MWRIVNGSRARRPLLVASAVLGAAVLAGGAGLGSYAVTGQVHHAKPAARTTYAPSVPSALAGATASPAAAASSNGAAAAASGVSRALADLVTAPGLGGRLAGQVTDVATGTTLYTRSAGTAVAPASTAKLLTAAAILSVHRPLDTFVTRVVAGPGKAVTIIGGGDPTLSGAAAGKSGYYRGAARISDLAAALHAAGVHPTRIYVDDGLFAGPGVSPHWAADDVPSTYASPITALMVDGGRAHPTDGELTTTPDIAAGEALAAALGTSSLPVSRGSAPKGARLLASVRSAPVSTLVTEMLQLSDNVIAEVLGRQVALATSRPASFTGAAAAIRTVLRGLGIDPGAGMVDASGLAAGDRLSAHTLADLVRLIAGPEHPELHDIVAALPVAGWSGTLADRYLSGSARAGAGVVRAKTGTLTGVSSLAGLVHDKSGRLLAFAFLAAGVASTPAADAALDDLAARLARCGCG